MGPFVLKITAFTGFICFNVIAFTKSVPLKGQSRTTLAEWTDYNTLEPQGPGTYSFGYDVEDPEKDNIQFRDEERFPNGTVRGSYGYLAPNGIVHIVHYTADENGYRATFENYPRGQLKPSIGTNKLPAEFQSSALKAAIQSRNIYKRQHVQEQRLRPINTKPPLPSASFIDNANDINSKETSDFSSYESNGERTHHVNPYLLFQSN